MRPAGRTVLADDFHVHGYPIDGTLPRWELQREAARRGLDVIAVTNHNQTIAGRLGGFLSGADVIVIPGQEITTPGFHMIAAGVTETIDWRLPASQAIAESTGRAAWPSLPIRSATPGSPVTSRRCAYSTGSRLRIR